MTPSLTGTMKKRKTKQLRPPGAAEAWNILIVDDEPEIHKITELALANVTFKDRELKFHSVFSGAEALEYMRDNEDTAVILLDVVMEHDHAGLETAQKIRHELHNRSTRIILRTGQPGQAPEREVITQYDINDYKAKTELTASKLFTTIIASLRSYHDILCLEANRHGLEKIVRASASVFALAVVSRFLRRSFDSDELHLFPAWRSSPHPASGRTDDCTLFSHRVGLECKRK